MLSSRTTLLKEAIDVQVKESRSTQAAGVSFFSGSSIISQRPAESRLPTNLGRTVPKCNGRTVV